MEPISENILKFFKSSKVKDYINHDEWEEFWNTARWDEDKKEGLTIEEITKLYDIVVESGVNCIEPPEAKMMHKYINSDGILNKNVRYRANYDESQIYKPLLPYIGRKVKVLTLCEDELFEKLESEDDNFAYCFWSLYIDGYKEVFNVCGDCIDFPQFGIKQLPLQ